MAVSNRLIVAFTLAFCVSCATSDTKPPDEIEDLRLEIDHCPLHNEPLIESVESVDSERGSYMPEYWLVRSELFPCAYDDPHSVGQPALVTYCPKCRFAKAKFLSAKDYPEPPWELRDKGIDEVFKQHRIQLDAFIARHRKELEEHYQNPQPTPESH